MNLAALALSVDKRNRTRSVIPPFCGRTIRYLEMSEVEVEVEEELGLNWVVAIFNTPCCWGGSTEGFWFLGKSCGGWLLVHVVGFNIGVYMRIDTTLIRMEIGPAFVESVEGFASTQLVRLYFGIIR